MIPKFRVFDKKYKKIMKVNEINFEKSSVWIESDSGDHENRHTLTRGFDEVILMQSTGVYDKHGVEIFEGDIIQQVHAYDYSILEIETDYLEPFEVKKGKYVQGKWIAKEVELKSHSAITCAFGSDVKVIGNVHQNSELLEVEDD